MTNKDTWIIANWKSNKTIKEALEWIDTVGPKVPRRPNLKVVVCPTFLALDEVKKAVLVGNYPLLVGAQDLSPFSEGPFTGEEAARLLSEVVDLAIIGHSERRKQFGETDQMVAEKVAQADKYSIIPLVCVQNQNTPVPDGAKLIAYEPLFAIGTGHPDTAANAGQMAGVLHNKYGQELAVLYGGSINEVNAKQFLAEENLNGLLIGGSSLNPLRFCQIVEQA